MKILIVDDETPIREWIQFSIERGNNPEYEIAALAENGKDALELAVRHQVDVVITDIEMPGMNGIELMKQVLKVMPYTSFVILTNYAEFSYAREAVTYGARQYLLKSELRGRDILKALDMIHAELKETVENKQVDFYSNGYLDIFDCYYNIENREFLCDFWKRHGFWEEEAFLTVAFEERDSRRQKEQIEAFLKKEGVHGVGPAMKNNHIFMLLQSNSEQRLVELAEEFAELYRKEELGFMVSGHIERGIDHVMEAIDEAEKMLRYGFLITGGYLSIHDARNIPPLDRHAVKKSGHKLCDSILFDEKDRILSEMDRWFTGLRAASYEDIEWVKEMCMQMVIRVEEIGAEHITGFAEEHRPDAQWTLEKSRDFCLNLIKRIYSTDNFRYSQSIRDAIKYIHQNYNKDISLNDVAQYIYRSPEYLSRRFKSETGENFSAYLMAYRLNKAKNLLLNTDMKIYEIAAAVGYTTPSYFSKMYREYMGTAPEVTRGQKNNKR